MYKRRFCAAVGIALVIAVVAIGQVQVNEYTQHQQTHPAVAMNDTGNFVVIWRSHVADGRAGGVFGRRFSADGAPAGGEFKINLSEVDVDTWAPAVAMTPSGDFVVAWVAAQEGDCDVVARMFDADGAPLTEEMPVATSADIAESVPQIAMNSTGAFVVVWTNWYGDVYTGRSYVAARVYGADGVPLSESSEVGDHPQQRWPDVAMDEEGRFVVSWIRMGDTYNRPYGEYIMIRRFDSDGTPLSVGRALTEDLNSRWYGPSVAVGRDGGFTVAWSIGPFPYDVVAQPFHVDGEPVTPPYMVNTRMEGNQGRPCIASNGEDFLIAWDSHDPGGSECVVGGQLCTGVGTLVGSEFTLQAETCSRNWYPTAAMAADGRYVVVWTAEAGDESGYDIFAQTGSREQ